MIGARAASVVSDGLVLVLTCIKTWQPKGLAEVLVMDIGTTIREILLKDSETCQFVPNSHADNMFPNFQRPCVLGLSTQNRLFSSPDMYDTDYFVLSTSLEWQLDI